MDPLRHDDIERARKTTPAEKARRTFELMRFGIRLKRTALRTRYPDETDEQIEARVREWLQQDD